MQCPYSKRLLSERSVGIKGARGHGTEAPFTSSFPRLVRMATADQLSAMLQAFSNMIQHRQAPNQEMFATVMRVVGMEVQAEERNPRGVLRKEELQRVKEFNRSG